MLHYGYIESICFVHTKCIYSLAHVSLRGFDGLGMAESHLEGPRIGPSLDLLDIMCCVAAPVAGRHLTYVAFFCLSPHTPHTYPSFLSFPI